MASAINSHVTLWIWEKTQDSSHAAVEYGHVALETTQLGKNKYISFCINPNCKLKPLIQNRYSGHFHENKKADDALQDGKKARSYKLYFLDISKINSAFKGFKSNPNAWGALGWGLLERAYSLNAYGLSAFLLDKGGIIDLPIYQNIGINTSTTQKIINSLGLFYAAINGWVSYLGYSLANQLKVPVRVLKRQIDDFPGSRDRGIERLERAIDPEKCSCKGHINQDTSVKCIKCLKNIFRLENYKKYFKEFDLFPWQTWCDEVTGFTADVVNASKRFLILASITIIALGAIRYINNRFIEGQFDGRDITILVEKAAYAEKSYCTKVMQVISSKELKNK